MTINNIKYSSNEQYHLHCKAKAFDDKVAMDKIMHEHDPGKIEGIGYNIKNVDHDVWRNQCQDIMINGLRNKFTQNEHLKTFLLGTENTTLVEASPSDHYWGCGLLLRNKYIWRLANWEQKGQNNLGKLLMQIRNEL